MTITTVEAYLSDALSRGHTAQQYLGLYTKTYLMQVEQYITPVLVPLTRVPLLNFP